MKDKNQEHSTDAVWVQMCLADDLDPQKRMASRLAILRHAEAQDCTLYRPDDEDESDDAEELDLGDARILFTGLFQAPAEWSEAERAELLAGKKILYSGPLSDRDGKERIAAGSVMPDADLWKMDWFVKGVKTQQ